MKSEAALYLLDKNVARRCVEGTAGLMEMRRLTSEEHLALQFLKTDRRLAPRLFITPQSYNILTFHFANRPETHITSTNLTPYKLQNNGDMRSWRHSAPNFMFV